MAAVALVALSAVPAAPAEAAPAYGWLRVGHFSPSTGPVDVYVDGHEVAHDVAYESVTPYTRESPGLHTVVFRRAGTAATAPAVVSGRAVVTAGGAVTVAAVSGPSGPVLRSIADDLATPPAGDANVRIVGLDSSLTSLQATLVSVTGTTATAAADTARYGPVSYGAASAYQALPAGHYDLTVTTTSGQKVIAGADWPVSSGDVASIVVATSAGKPTIEVLRDAAGTTAMPRGKIQTGFGGTADWGPTGAPSSPWVGGAAVAATGAALLVALRRRRLVA
jgi:hypothetical protein